jgi:hypothetical protein
MELDRRRRLASQPFSEKARICLSSNAYVRWVVTLIILDFPNEWFAERVSSNGGLERGLPLDQLKGYANPDGPLALLLLRK